MVDKGPFLQPCPFDGGVASLNQKTSRAFPFKVECTVCKASTTRFRQIKMAVDAWNRRVT